MADLQTASCDVCRVVKKDSNHWFRVWINAMEWLNAEGIVCIAPWNAEVSAKHFHCCGPAHALQKVAELMGQAAVPSTEPPPVRVELTKEDSDV